MPIVPVVDLWCAVLQLTSEKASRALKPRKAQHRRHGSGEIKKIRKPIANNQSA